MLNDEISEICADSKWFVSPSYERWAWIDRETWLPLKYERYEPEFNFRSVVEFRNFEVNAGVADSEFEFDIPENVMVITFEEYVNSSY